MSTAATAIVAPLSARNETWLVAAVTAAVLAIGGFAVSQRQVEDDQQRLFDWQISAFYDMNPSDQAIYNASQTISDEVTKAMDKFRPDARKAEADRIRAKAEAQKDFTVNTAHARLTYVTDAASYLKAYLAAESNAHYDLIQTVVTEQADYWVLATDASWSPVVMRCSTRDSK